MINSIPSKDSPEFLIEVGSALEPASSELKPGNRCGQGVTGRALSLAEKFSLKEGQTVVVEALNSRDVIETIFACFKLGLHVVLLPPGLKEAEREKYLKSLDFEMIFDSSLVSKGDSGLDFEKSREELPLKLSSKVLFFTSGSSSKPKLVVHSLGSLFNVATASNAITKLTETGVWLLTLPINHVGGFSILLRSVLAGAKVGLAQNLGLKNLKEKIRLFKATHISLVPTMLEALVQDYSLNQSLSQSSSLKAVLVSGAPIDNSLLRKAVELGTPIVCSYGLTEAGSTVCSTGILDSSEDTIGHAGKCLSGVELRIVDCSTKHETKHATKQEICEVSQGIVGEIQLRGKNLFDGYYEESFAGSSSGKYLLDWFSTGDLARIDEKRNLQLVGRSSRIIISGGENINPLEIEQLAEEHSFVFKAAVVAIPSKKWGERPILFVELQQGCEVSKVKEVLATFLKERLSSIRCPDRIEVVDQIPMLSVGKVDYQGLLVAS